MSEARNRELLMERALQSILYGQDEGTAPRRAKTMRRIADQALQDVKRSRDVEREADRLFEQWARKEMHAGPTITAAIKEHERRMFHVSGELLEP